MCAYDPCEVRGISCAGRQGALCIGKKSPKPLVFFLVRQSPFLDGCHKRVHNFFLLSALVGIWVGNVRSVHRQFIDTFLRVLCYVYAMHHHPPPVYACSLLIGA